MSSTDFPDCRSSVRRHPGARPVNAVRNQALLNGLRAHKGTQRSFAKEFLRRERQRRPTMGEVRSLERQIARLKNLSGGNF